MKYIYKVSGMSCNHCVRRVEQALKSSSVESVIVSLEDNTATITSDREPDLEELNRLLSEAGAYQLIKG